MVVRGDMITRKRVTILQGLLGGFLIGSASGAEQLNVLLEESFDFILKDVVIDAKEVGKETDEHLKDQESCDYQSKPLSRREQFIKDCALYVIEPGWVIKTFMNMNVNECTEAWSILVSYIKSKPMFLFTNDEKAVLDREHRFLLQRYCEQFDQFLKFAVVTPDNYVDLQMQKGGAVSLMNHWSKKKNNDVAHFYAFYFDCVAAHFIELLNDVFLSDDAAFFEKASFQLQSCFLKLLNIYTKLERTEYDERYFFYLKRYTELIVILQKRES